MTNHSPPQQDKRWQLLTAVATQREVNIDTRISHALEETLKLLELDIGILSRINGDIYTVVNFSAPTEAPLHRGQDFALGQTYCAITVDAMQVVAIDEMKESKYNRHPCYEAFQLESYIGTPVFVYGERFGTLNFSSPTPHKQLFVEEDKQLIDLLAQWVGSELERQQHDREKSTIENSLRRLATQLTVVSEINTAVSSITTLNALLTKVADLTKDRFSLLHVDIFLLNRQKDTLLLAAGAGELGRQMVEQKQQILIDASNSLVGLAAKNKQNQVTQYDDNHAAINLPHTVVAEAKTGMAVPILSEKDLLGVLQIHSQNENAFDDIDHQIFTSLVTQIGITIQNIRRLEQTQTVSEETNKLYEVSRKINTATTSQELLQSLLKPLLSQGAYFGNLFEIETNDQEQPQFITQLDSWVLEGDPPFPNGTRFDLSLFSVSQYWVDDGQIVLFGDIDTDDRLDQNTKDVYAQAGAKAAAIYPLRLGDTWLGVINVNWNQVQHFTKADIRFFESLTNQMAVALHSQNLIKQTTTRANQLQLVAEVSTAINSVAEVDDMLQAVVNLTKDRFGLYHAHIFLLNEERDQLVLMAGAGEVGREMVAEGRIIPLDTETSLVATSARLRKAQARFYDGEMEGYAPHPALIDTRSELAVPLLTGNHLIGVLDIRSVEPLAFDEMDHQIQSALGAQVAIAIQNTRQYEKTQQALGETAANAESTARLTRLSIALNAIENEHDAFATLAKHAKNIIDSERVSVTLLNKEHTQFEVFALDGLAGTIPVNVTLPFTGTILGKSVLDDQLTIEPDTGLSEFIDSQALYKSGILSTIMAPIKVADDTIGTLNFGFTTVYEENQNLRLLIQQMVLMFNQTLTKSRYLEQSRKQVLQLKTVSDVSANISSIQEIDELAKSVVDLTKERFGLYHSHIYLINDIGNNLILSAGTGKRAISW